MNVEDAEGAANPWTVTQDAELEKFYAKHNAKTIKQKIALHMNVLGRCNISSSTGKITRLQVLRVLEIEYLESRGLITLTTL